mmetsp:Transcript_36949/g.73117  ORF Transcript_36949/g.73117 Transcript_36949/m.73117 type:complete len:254 (+) Transcript_36949:352-1113(+)
MACGAFGFEPFQDCLAIEQAGRAHTQISVFVLHTRHVRALVLDHAVERCQQSCLQGCTLVTLQSKECFRHCFERRQATLAWLFPEEVAALLCGTEDHTWQCLQPRGAIHHSFRLRPAAVDEDESPQASSASNRFFFWPQHLRIRPRAHQHTTVPVGMDSLMQRRICIRLRETVRHLDNQVLQAESKKRCRSQCTLGFLWVHQNDNACGCDQGSVGWQRAAYTGVLWAETARARWPHIYWRYRGFISVGHHQKT